jgi:hypothetical protein
VIESAGAVEGIRVKDPNHPVDQASASSAKVNGLTRRTATARIISKMVAHPPLVLRSEALLRSAEAAGPFGCARP